MTEAILTIFVGIFTVIGPVASKTQPRPRPASGLADARQRLDSSDAKARAEGRLWRAQLACEAMLLADAEAAIASSEPITKTPHADRLIDGSETGYITANTITTVRICAVTVSPPRVKPIAWPTGFVTDSTRAFSPGGVVLQPEPESPRAYSWSEHARFDVHYQVGSWRQRLARDERDQRTDLTAIRVSAITLALALTTALVAPWFAAWTLLTISIFIAVLAFGAVLLSGRDYDEALIRARSSRRHLADALTRNCDDLDNQLNHPTDWKAAA